MAPQAESVFGSAMPISPDGWVKLYRELLSKPVWKQSNPGQRSVLIAILLLASYRPNSWEWMGQQFTVQPGQFVTSLEELRKAAGKGVSKQCVRSALVRFKKLQFSTYESTKQGRLITIINWDSYQSGEDKANIDANIEPTKSQQRANIEPTPIKKVRIKEGKNKEKPFLSENPRNSPTTRTPNSKKRGTEEDLQLAKHMYAQILVVCPTARAPNWPSWANDIRLMRERDEREPEEILALFDWANRDQFWAANIMCPATLRKQWDKLVAKRGAVQRASASINTGPPDISEIDTW